MSHDTNAMGRHYYVPQPSLYPFMLAGSLFLLALGFIMAVNDVGLGRGLMVGGLGIILYVLYGWLRKVVAESESGAYREWEDRSFRYSMIWFIASEVAFFTAFFGALFYLRVVSVPVLGEMEAAHGLTLWPGYGGHWPSSGPQGPQFTPMGAWGVPALNTALLLTSGATLTWAHWGLLQGKRRQLNLGLAATVLLGFTFIGFQAYEYHHAYTELGLTLGAGAYGATFFMLTGFHGFHVTLGVVMLSVILGRCLKGHFNAERHFAFEGVAWYWHFVDVVWLLLFVFIYWL